MDNPTPVVERLRVRNKRFTAITFIIILVVVVIIVMAQRRGALTSRESDGLTALVAVGLAFFMILSKSRWMKEYKQLSTEEQLALQPTEQETERSRRRTRVWYVVVLCAFLIGIALIALAHAAGQSSPPLTMIIPSILGAGAVGLVLYLDSKNRRRNAGVSATAHNEATVVNNKAVALLGTGEVLEAANMLDDILARHAFQGSFRSLLAWNQGVARLRLGDTTGANASFEDALTSLGRFSGGVRPNLWCLLALSHAIAGDLATAQRFQSQVREYNRKRDDVMTRLANAFLLICEGRHADAIESAQPDKVDKARERDSHEWRGVRLLAAYSLTKADANDNSAGVSELIRVAKPAYPGEFDYLAGRLPELRSFLDEHGFSGPRPAA